MADSQRREYILIVNINQKLYFNVNSKNRFIDKTK